MKVDDVYSGLSKPPRFRPIVINTSEGELKLNEPSIRELDGRRMVSSILNKEKPPITIWKDIAITYYRLGLFDDYEHIIKSMRDREYDYLTYEGENYKDIKIDLLNSLACHSLYVKNDVAFAKQLVGEANSIDPQNPMTSIMQALVELQSDDTPWDSVKKLVTISMKMRSKSIPVQMAHACVLYHEENYKEALNIYKNILESNSNAPAEIRLGIGLCHYQMGNMVTAKKAFERTRVLDKTNTGCLIGLALIELNQPRKERDMRKAMGYAKAAYKIDPNNAMALNILSKHFYARGEYDKVEKLTNRAIKNSLVPIVKSESFFQLFKVALANDNMEDAQKMLKCIQDLDPKKFALGDFAIGHMNLHNNKVGAAIKAFEKGLKSHRKSYYANKILGRLYVEQNNPHLALKHLKEANRYSPHDDIELLLELANLEPNPVDALQFMQRAHVFIEKNPDQSPVSLDSFIFWSNYGSLHERNNELDIALKYYEKALHLAKATVQSYDDAHVYLLFNIARVYETHSLEWVENEIKALKEKSNKLAKDNEKSAEIIKNIIKKKERNDAIKRDYRIKRMEEKKQALVKVAIGEINERLKGLQHFKENPVDYFKEAKEIYLSLAKSHPYFLEPFLRMAQIADKENDLDQAVHWCHLASAVNAQSPLAYGVLGSIYFRRNQWSKAQEEFQKIIALDAKHSYANLALGCIYFYQVVNLKISKREDEDRFFRYMNHAARLFRTAISLDPSNSHAAVSLSAVIAERGYVAQAREMFSKIREYTQTICDLWLNLGNTELFQGRPMNSIKTYEHCLDNLPDTGRKKRLGELYHLIAHAYYKYDRLDDTSTYLDKSSTYLPKSHTVDYNRNVAKYSSATKLIFKLTTPIEARRSAMKAIEDAEREFERLSDVDSQQIKFKAKQFAERIHAKLSKFKQELKTYEEKESELIKKREASLAVMKAQMEEKNRKNEEQQALLREEEERARKLERENEEQMEYLRSNDRDFISIKKVSNPEDSDVTISSRVNVAEAKLEAEYSLNPPASPSKNQKVDDDVESDDEFGDMAEAFGNSDDEESDDSSKRSREEKSGSDDVFDDISLEPPSKRKRTL